MFTPQYHQHGTDFEFLQQTDAAETARRSNRRRLTVFLIVFLSTLLPGLAWNFMRPAEYRATARIQITPGAVSPRADNALAPNVAEQPGPRIDVLTQIQILNSRSLLEEVSRRLADGGKPAALLGSDPIADLQNAVSASPVSGTDIVEVQAVGASPQWLARAVNTLVDAYRERLFASHGTASQDVLANLRDEVERLGTSIAGKRAQLAAFRERSGVVSSERSENAALARIKGLSESLNRANEDAAKAEARLRTLRESAASGRSPVLSKDNPTQAAIEQRISATREQLRDMERSYTPDFMAMDPTARSLRGRLAELERQLSSNRSTSQQAALAASEEEVAGTRATIDRLRGQLEAQRREAQVFFREFPRGQGAGG